MPAIVNFDRYFSFILDVAFLIAISKKTCLWTAWKQLCLKGTPDVKAIELLEFLIHEKHMKTAKNVAMFFSHHCPPKKNFDSHTNVQAS